MRLRTLCFLVAALLVAEIAVLWSSSRTANRQGTVFVDTPLLEVADLERAQRIVVREKPQSKLMQKGEDGFEVRMIVAPDAPIRETVLERRGESWVVANCFGLDVDSNWLGQTMRDLTQGQLTRHLTADPALMTDLDLHLGQVRLEDGQGKILRQLDFGRKDGGAAYQFVRVNGQDAYVARHETEIVGDPYSWIVNRILPFEVADVREFTLPVQDAKEAPLVFQRSERGKAFELTGEAVPEPLRAAQNAERILARLVTEPIMIAFPLENPAARAAKNHVRARLRVALFDGRTYAVAYGVLPAEDQNLQSIPEEVRNDVAFAWVETSHPNDIALRYIAKAAIAYNKNSIIDRLPPTRAQAAGRPPSAAEGPP